MIIQQGGYISFNPDYELIEQRQEEAGVVFQKPAATIGDRLAFLKKMVDCPSQPAQILLKENIKRSIKLTPTKQFLEIENRIAKLERIIPIDFPRRVACLINTLKAIKAPIDNSQIKHDLHIKLDSAYSIVHQLIDCHQAYKGLDQRLSNLKQISQVSTSIRLENKSLPKKHQEVLKRVETLEKVLDELEAREP